MYTYLQIYIHYIGLTENVILCIGVILHSYSIHTNEWDNVNYSIATAYLAYNPLTADDKEYKISKIAA